LTTQFGENFKQLNSAVFDLVTWQGNYKSSMEFMKNSEESLATITNRNSEIVEIYEKLSESLENFKNSLVALTDNFLKNYKKFLEDAKN